MNVELKNILLQIEEAIDYAQASDHSYTRYYRALLRKRRLLKRLIKRFDRIDVKN